jgi:hypothetical protein
MIEDEIGTSIGNAVIEVHYKLALGLSKAEVTSFVDCFDFKTLRLCTSAGGKRIGREFSPGGI